MTNSDKSVGPVLTKAWPRFTTDMFLVAGGVYVFFSTDDLETWWIRTILQVLAFLIVVSGVSDGVRSLTPMERDSMGRPVQRGTASHDSRF